MGLCPRVRVCVLRSEHLRLFFVPTLLRKSAAERITSRACGCVVNATRGCVCV